MAKAVLKPIEPAFTPREITITLETQAEFDAFQTLMARDTFVPKFLEEEWSITSQTKTAMSSMMHTIYRSLDEQ